MSISELGSLGELVSSIVVLITLIYLAVQVRHSKNIAMGHSYQYSRGLIGEEQMLQAAERVKMADGFWVHMTEYIPPHIRSSYEEHKRD